MAYIGPVVRLVVLKCSNGYMVQPPEYDLARDKVTSPADSYVFESWDSTQKHMKNAFEGKV